MWGPSGVASDGGHVFVTTGNTFGAEVWSGGEAILRFPAAVDLASATPDFFAPRDWKELDEGDVDLGGTGPVLVDVPGADPSALAIALGKDGKIYLADRAKLGGVGDGDTGEAVLPPVPVGGKTRRFQTPVLAAGRIFVAVDGGVKAFRVR
jgi:hypothetical protein